MTRRFVSLWFPHWPTDVWQRRQWTAATPEANAAPETRAAPATSLTAALALTVQEAGTRRLYAVNAAAAGLGLRAGMAVADAQALIPDLPVRDAAPEHDAAQLLKAADWCLRYTPLVTLDGTDGLLLDITGCAHLFGGEAAMTTDMHSRLQALGFHVRIAVADTAAAARACARFGRTAATKSAAAKAADRTPRRRQNSDIFIHIVPQGETRTALQALPVNALTLSEADHTSLHRVGLRTVGDLYRLPRRALAARFPARVSNRISARLHEALDVETALFQPLQPPPDYLVRKVFAEPIARQEDIVAAARLLLDQLLALLQRDGLGARKLRLTLFLCDGGQLPFELGLALPSADAAHIMRLWHERLQGLEAGFGADILTLTALQHDVLTPHQFALAAPRPAAAAPASPGPKMSEPGLNLVPPGDAAAAPPAWRDPALALLVDRLVNRLGARHVVHLHGFASHLPERAYRVLPALAWTRLSTAMRDEAAEAQAHWADLPARPLLLLPVPEPVDVMAAVPDGPPMLFRRHGRTHRVRAAEGPERIAPEWWRALGTAQKPTRDYFRIEATDGSRYWLYRDGLYDETDATPRWFLHGLFA